MNAARGVLARAFLGHLLAQPARSVMSIAALALGVALGVAVALVNASALDEFGRGMRTVAGAADLEVRGARAGFDENLYAVLAAREDIAAASPLIEIEARVAGRDDTLRLIGLDPLRAAQLAPALTLPRTEGEAAARESLFEDDGVWLSAAAAQDFGLRAGDVLALQSGVDTVRLRVAGVLPAAGAQRLAVADIATVQWRFARLGQLTRIDLRVADGVPLATARAAIAAVLPPGVGARTPDEAESRAADLSRAYRVNLGMLALIALVTGGFLTFSAQALAVVRRRGELAFLRAQGVTAQAVQRWVLAEGALIGTLASALGAAAGVALAWAALQVLGGDLGAGYFDGARPRLTVDAMSIAGYMLAGVAAALAGSWLPARDAARAAPAQGLKSGAAAVSLARIDRLWPALTCFVAAAVLVRLPPLAGLPVFGYLAIAAILLGSVLAMPRVARLVFARLPASRAAWRQVGIEQLRGAPQLASIGAAGVLAAVALAAAMAIMVSSFRHSVDDWLEQVLPAQLYLRAARSGDSGFLDPAAQRAIAAVPGVARVDFLRHQSVLLDPERAPVALIARPFSDAAPYSPLPLVTRAEAPAGAPVALVSEAVVDLYGVRAGERLRLPLAGREVEFFVAGVWRDYVRQQGAIAIDLAAYRAASGDALANDAAIWLAPDADARQVRAALARALPGEAIEIAEPGAIRALSLGIFDRTFAVTYVLEAVAIVIGLAGVAASFAALAAARRREFGMLRHLGFTRGEVARMLALEGALVAALGVTLGLLAGGAISAILIEVVNRQSFHWSMDIVVPWRSLAVFGVAMVALATLAAVAAARAAMQGGALRAVREDW